VQTGPTPAPVRAQIVATSAPSDTLLLLLFSERLSASSSAHGKNRTKREREKPELNYPARVYFSVWSSAPLGASLRGNEPSEMGKGPGIPFKRREALAAQAPSARVALTLAAKTPPCQTDPLPRALPVGVKCLQDFLPLMPFLHL